MIGIVVKVPGCRARIFPRKWEKFQNWYVLCKKAARLANENNLSIFIPSGFAPLGEEETEAQVYIRTLKSLGVSREKIAVIGGVYETIGQVEVFLNEKKLTLIVDTLQYPRVRWMCRGKKFKYVIAWGLPNLQEVITDSILIFLFPVLDLLGLRNGFKDRLIKRRKTGKL